MRQVVASLIAFSGGVAVGTAFVAFVTVLSLIPRVAEIVNPADPLRAVRQLEWPLWGGALLAALSLALPVRLPLPALATIPVGLGMGFFFGMVTAALVEVLNVLPILGHRTGLESFIGWLVVAVVVGKTLGSLVYWLFPALW